MHVNVVLLNNFILICTCIVIKMFIKFIKFLMPMHIRKYLSWIEHLNIFQEAMIFYRSLLLTTITIIYRIRVNFCCM